MRLIDADAMHKFVEDKVAEGKDGWSNGVPYEWAYALTAVDAQPTIDAEPVVRCNMCKYYEAEVGFCYYHDHGMHWDDFCSRCAKMDLEAQDD